MRGKPFPWGCPPLVWRNIPAYAGKTAESEIVSYAASEHPRVCGENRCSQAQFQTPRGTSPRMRGKRMLRNRRTSPRMRGKPTQSMATMKQGGNIPAYAGKTLRQVAAQVIHAEHPRVCGENPIRRVRLNPRGGTSPRMRGKPRYSGRPHSHRRNIPAYAGKTNAEEQKKKLEAEHPRVCGENFLADAVETFAPGTSPRMRGKRLHHSRVLLERGNIPAYAGKTSAHPPHQ